MKSQEFKNISFLWPENFSGLGFAFFNKSPYEDTLFVYINKDTYFKQKLTIETAMTISGLTNYTESITRTEELYSMLDGFTEEEKIDYIQLLAEHHLNDYEILGLLLCEDSFSLIKQFMSVTSTEEAIPVYYLNKGPENDEEFKQDIIKSFSSPMIESNWKSDVRQYLETDLMETIKDYCETPNKENFPEWFPKAFDYHPEDNSEKMTVYIILRSDLDRSVAEQICDSVLLMDKLEEDYRFQDFKSEWDAQIVILQAQYDDLFVNNFIPAKPSDPNLIFATTTSMDTRVAPGNFRLSEAQINGIAYMGRKCDMPKFVRKLQTWR